MDKEKKLAQIMSFMKENGSKIKWMAKEKCRVQTEAAMKVVIGKIWDMGMGLQLMRGGISMKVNGKMIKEMEKEDMIGNLENFMKETGKIINKTDKEKWNMRMALFMKGIGKIIWDMDRELKLMVKDNVFNREHGKKIS